MELERFDNDFDLVTRPKKRAKTQPTENKSDDRLERQQSRKNGFNLLMKTKNICWKPTFEPGISATPTREPRLNTPKNLVVSIPHIYARSDDGRSLSPHQYSKDYFVDTHSLKTNRSQLKQEYLQKQAIILSGNETI
jgi:hypothetical protein